MGTPEMQIPDMQYFYEEWVLEPVTCAVVESLFFRLYGAETEMCRLIQEGAEFCGCESKELRRREVIFAWLPRVSATLSFLVRTQYLFI